MKIVNPLSPSLAEEDIKTVLYALAGQGGCDGEPYDQIQQAADYIAELEAECRSSYNEGISVGEKERLRLGGRILELEATVEKLKCCGNCKYFLQDEMDCLYCEIDMYPLPKYYERCDKWEKR